MIGVAAHPERVGDDRDPPAPTAAAVDAAYEECGRITRASARSNQHAVRLRPVARRRGLDALYAFWRAVDDAADEAADPAEAIAAWRVELAHAVAGTPTHPVAVALADAIRRFGIAPQHLGEIIDGVSMDLDRSRYETFDELRRYCYHVAAAVGLAALPIFGCRDPRSRIYAEALGIALQLTNILRDVAEDAELGRIYLPLGDLRRFGYRERELLTHTRNAAWRELVAYECARARELFAAARKNLPPADRRALAPAEGMRLVYQRLLARLAANPDAIFGPRMRVSLPQKALCTVLAWARTRGSGA
jgi:phytoene synthase